MGRENLKWRGKLEIAAKSNRLLTLQYAKLTGSRPIVLNVLSSLFVFFFSFLAVGAGELAQW